MSPIKLRIKVKIYDSVVDYEVKMTQTITFYHN